MTECPICQTSRRDMLPADVYVSTDALHILQRLNPTWAESDGLCQRCFEAAMDTACELEDMQIEQGVPGFTQYYRYHLTRKESKQWHHQNEDLAKWHRESIDERVALEAKASGYDSWIIFGPDEELLAQGCFTEAQEE